MRPSCLLGRLKIDARRGRVEAALQSSPGFLQSDNGTPRVGATVGGAPPEMLPPSMSPWGKPMAEGGQQGPQMLGVE
jgi:hypothetical protein